MSDELLTSTDPSTPTLDADKQDYLRYLSIGNYVMAGLAFLFGMIPILHVVMGFTLMSQVFSQESAGRDEIVMGSVFGLLFGVLGLVLVLCFWGYGFFMIKAARGLRDRRHHMLCLVMAALSCVLAPIGTVLGVFTILVLMDSDVKAAFKR